ncbi:MAG: glycosyltransferase [Verrucomicrobiota bacterium]
MSSDARQTGKGKLLFVIKGLAAGAGGAEKVLVTLLNQIADRFDLVLVTFDKKGAESFYPLDARVKWLRSPLGDPRAPTRPTNFFRKIRALKQVIVQEKPDLAIGFMHSSFILLAFACIGNRLPVVASEHIVMDHYRSRPAQFLLWCFACLRVQKVVFVGKNIPQDFPQLFSDRYTVIPNPIDLEGFSDGPTERKPIILSVGRLEPQKNLALLMEAFSDLVSDFPHYELRVVGDGSEREQLESLAGRLGILSKTHFLGRISTVKQEYERAEIFAIPSLYESFGLVAAEAMYAELPVVALKECPGLSAFLVDRENALLVYKEKGHQGFSDALRKLAEDKTLRERLGENGKKRVLAMPNDDAIIEMWIELFEGLSPAIVG